MIFSAAPIVVLIALWDLLLVWQLGKAGFFAGWIGDDPAHAAKESQA